MQAIAQIEPEMLRRYPQSDRAGYFYPKQRRDCARVFRPESIIAGNGSDDILAIAMQTFLSPGDTLAMPDPTYSLYPVLAELDEVKIASVPWEKRWAAPMEALLATRPRAIFWRILMRCIGDVCQPAKARRARA